MGARHGVPDRDARARQAGRQHGQSAMGLPARLPILFPGLRRRRHVGRSRKHRDAGRALSAHAATAEHGDDLPAHPAAAQAEGYPWVGKSIEHQFAKFSYPAPGHAPVRMMYKYGGSILSTMNNTNRWVRMYQSPNLEFVVNQSIWFEGEAKFADVILPACTNFERVDISEWA